MKTIKILDNGTDRYTISANDYILGRMYDNEAEEVYVEKPKSEANSICTMIITCMDFVVDHINVGSEPIKIKSNISQYEHVRIGFAFTRADGYVKNSEIKKFSFLEAQKPDGFVPVESEQKTSIEYLLQFGFAKCDQQGTMLNFYNANNEVVSSINLNLFTPTLEETDPTVPTHVKEITEQDIHNWNSKSEFSGSYNDLKDKPEQPKIPTKLSEFENDEGFIKEIPSEYVTENELNNKSYATTKEVSDAVKDKATTDYVDQKVADLVNSAPTTLDTLGEVAQAIAENESVVDALNSAIGKKIDRSEMDSYVTDEEFDEVNNRVGNLENKTLPKLNILSSAVGRYSVNSDGTIKNNDTTFNTLEYDGTEGKTTPALARQSHMDAVIGSHNLLVQRVSTLETDLTGLNTALETILGV